MYLTVPSAPVTQYFLFKHNVVPVMVCKEDVFLVSSILLETLSTCFLKNTLNNKLWYAPVYAGYGLSFWVFPKALRKYSLSLAYTVWSGGGIILTTVFDKLFYNEMITFKRLLASFLIILGLVTSNS